LQIGQARVELGIAVAPSTILRWVVRYAEEFARCWEPFELMVGRSWHAGETYIKVNLAPGSRCVGATEPAGSIQGFATC
jgi:transposase-like protein